MAKLFDPSTQERPIARPALGIVEIPAVKRSGIEAQGLASLGKSIVEGGDEIYRAEKVEQDRINTMRADDAFNDLRNRQLDLTVGEENGFTKLKGASAVTRPINQEWMKRFDDAQTEIANGLTNDMQREKFKKRADVARLQFNEGILRHLAQEGDTYSKEVFDGTVAAEIKNAEARWDSPNDIGFSLERVKHAVDERADRYGWAPDYRDAVLRQEQGKVHTAVIDQALGSRNYEYAQHWFDTHREEIDPSTSKQLGLAVQNGAQKDRTNTYNTEYLANEDSQPALESLRKKVLSDTTLDEDRRNVLVGRIQNRQYVLERRNEVEQNKRLRLVEKGVNEFNANTLAGFEPNADQFQPLVDAAKGTELEPDVRQAIQLADATRQFRNMPPLQQEQTLINAESEIRTNPTKFDRRVVQAWRTIYDAQREQVKNAPIEFAVRQGLVERPAPLDLVNPENAGPALAERFAISRGVSTRYQGPFKPLMTEEVTLMKSALGNATAEQKRNYFASLSKAAGEDRQGYMAIMSQLAPDDPVTAIAGSQAALGRSQSADLMLRGQAILRPSTKTDGKPDGSSLLPMPPETDMRSAFDNQIRETFAGKPELRNAHFQAAKSIYAALSVDAGDKDTKVLNSDRWEKSIEMAVGQIDKYNGRRVVLPYNQDYGQFKDGIADRVDQLLSASATAGVRFNALKTLSPEKGKEQLQEIAKSKAYALDPSWTASRLKDLPLENVGDGRYVFRVGDNVVTDRLGRPVVIDFNTSAPHVNTGSDYMRALTGKVQ